MRTIQNAVLRCWLSFLSLLMISRVVARFRRPTPSLATVPAQLASPVEEQPTDDEHYTADAEDTFAAWDVQRAEKLHEAQDCEQQGLRLLAKATLLRVAIQCDDRGETLHAQELRERAQLLNTESVDVLSAENYWQPTELRIFDPDEMPAKVGA
jgi:hypothetical protein